MLALCLCAETATCAGSDLRLTCDMADSTSGILEHRELDGCRGGSIGGRFLVLWEGAGAGDLFDEGLGEVPAFVDSLVLSSRTPRNDCGNGKVLFSCRDLSRWFAFSAATRSAIDMLMLMKVIE